MPLTADTALADLLQALPALQPHWDDHRAAHAGEPVDLDDDCLELAAIAHAWLERPAQHADELRTLFAHTEAMLADGEPALAEALCSSFLEGLLHPLTPAMPGAAVLPGLLGPLSRAYARHWVAVTGSALTGL
jgi:hypothetical protein